MLFALALCMGGIRRIQVRNFLRSPSPAQGLASSGLTVVVRSIIGDGGSVENRGLYNGYISGSEGGGMVLGPVISGWLAIHWPLSVPFLLVALSLPHCSRYSHGYQRLHTETICIIRSFPFSQQSSLQSESE